MGVAIFDPGVEVISVREGVLRVDVRVKPRSAKNSAEYLSGDESLVVRLKAPPADGRANEALRDFLSEILDCPRNRIRIESGATSRIKRISIQGMEKEAFVLSMIGRSREQVN